MRWSARVTGYYFELMTEVVDVYEGLEPAELWRHFARLNAIPRPPGQEAAARSYVKEVAERARATHRTDRRGNTVVYLPTRGGSSHARPISVQAHLDMVCEKRPGSDHDFDKDAIRPRREGDWIYATDTTLGADNGIGVAACLSLMTEPNLQHGPLELLFTVEEETGLHGASDLDPSLLEARTLINLDSEDPNSLTVGCAGGASIYGRIALTREPVRGNVGRELRVSGLRGGHSGIQIHEKLANAIKLVARGLQTLQAAGIDFQLAAIEGGTAHNAIPRDAFAMLAIASDDANDFDSVVGEFRNELYAEWGDAEPGLRLVSVDAPLPKEAVRADQRDALLRFLLEAPHGVLQMSAHFPDTVQTSSNLANGRIDDSSVEVLVSVRSLVQSDLDELSLEIARLVESSGGSARVSDAYPGWEPDPASRILHLAKQKYLEVNGRSAKVEVVHAGLECGVIASKVPGMDAISFGPRIEGPHSPDERVYAPTVEPMWRLLTSLLEALAG